MRVTRVHGVKANYFILFKADIGPSAANIKATIINPVIYLKPVLNLLFKPILCYIVQGGQRHIFSVIPGIVPYLVATASLSST